MWYLCDIACLDKRQRLCRTIQYQGHIVKNKMMMRLKLYIFENEVETLREKKEKREKKVTRRVLLNKCYLSKK